MSDVFGNVSNNYVYPSLSACPNIADDQILTWSKNGLTIIKGSQEIASVDFSDLAIPINSFNKQQKILQPGEVVFVQGLTKSLYNRTQGFTLPSLVSDDDDLNSYYMRIDMSVNYYSSFVYTYKNIDISANYDENIAIDDALTIELSNKSINATSTYDPSILTFSGDAEGYDFNISNVVLTIIDSSMDADSPFQHDQNAATYELEEDPSYNINYAKYLNTGMQGVIIKGIFPDDDQEECDNWIYINHVSDYINIYTETSINYNADVSTNLSITFNPTTFVEPSISFDPSVIDTSLYNQSITDYLIQDCSIDLCDVSTSKSYSSLFTNCLIHDSSFANNNLINNDTSVWNSIFTDTWMNAYRLLVYTDPSGNKTYEFTIDDVSLESLKNVNIYESTIWDSSINKANINDCSIYNSYLKDCSIVDCTIYNCKYDSSTTLIGTTNYMVDASIECDYDVNYDSSSAYFKYLKRLDVGMNGNSTSSEISAGDYLNWVTINNYWKKFGEVYIWISSIDSSEANVKNLIDGFYLYNPHDFSVKVEYMTIL